MFWQERELRVGDLRSYGDDMYIVIDMNTETATIMFFNKAAYRGSGIRYWGANFCAEDPLISRGESP